MNTTFYKYITGKIGIIPCTNPKMLLFSDGDTLRGSNLYYFDLNVNKFKNMYVARSVQDAIDNNVSVYVMKRGCRHGHIPIYDLNGQCVECVKHAAKPLDGRASPTTIMMHNAPDMIIDRESAILVGFTVYRDGSECHRGHKAYRYVKNKTCVECQRLY